MLTFAAALCYNLQLVELGVVIPTGGREFAPSGVLLPSMPSHPKPYFGGVGMFKGKFAVLTLLVAAVALSWSFMPASVNTAYSGIVDPCESSAVMGAGPFCMVADLVGGGDQLSDLGADISVVAKDNTGAGIPNIPAADFWVVGCTDGLVLCGGSAAVNADSVTNAAGETTITNQLRVGGCDTGLQVVIQGTVVNETGNCGTALCLPIAVNTTDLNGDLLSNLQDFSAFAQQFPTTANPNPVFNPCLDYDCSGGPLLGLVDFSIFAQHYDNEC